MYEPEIETAPWEEQAGGDDALYVRQIGYLLERSVFYREKLAAAGFRDAKSVGGLADIAAEHDRPMRSTFDRQRSP